MLTLLQPAGAIEMLLLLRCCRCCCDIDAAAALITTPADSFTLWRVTYDADTPCRAIYAAHYAGHADTAYA